MSDDEYEDEDFEYAASDVSDAASDAAEEAPAAAVADDSDAEVEVDSEDEEEGEDNAEPVEATEPPPRARLDGVIKASNRPIRTIIVPAHERITDNRLHKSEAADIIAMRAQQIAASAMSFEDTSRDPARESYIKAYKELYQRRCPLILRRQIGWGSEGEKIIEEWNVREMTLPLIALPQ